MAVRMLLFSAVSAVPLGEQNLQTLIPTVVSMCRDRRPPPSNRTFASEAVDELVARIGSRMADRTLACLFSNTLPNTLDTTVLKAPRGNGESEATFIVTGDIPAMWLRDATNQVLPYVRLAAQDRRLARMLFGLLRQQARLVLNDPYANAHSPPPRHEGSGAAASPNSADDTSSPSPRCDQQALAIANGSLPIDGGGRRQSGMRPGVFERKWELDSILAFLKLGRRLHETLRSSSSARSGTTGTSTSSATPATLSPAAPLDAAFDATWLDAVALVLRTLRAQQRSTGEDAASPCGPAYSFRRGLGGSGGGGSNPLDTLVGGVGRPAARTGMVRSAFRPSDDACAYPFHIPSNAMAVVELRATATLLRALASRRRSERDARRRGDADADRGERETQERGLAIECEAIAREVEAGIATHGVVRRADFRPEGTFGGSVYAYEVDGMGGAKFMDDANLPSLLSLPWLGFVPATDPTCARAPPRAPRPRVCTACTPDVRRAALTVPTRPRGWRA